MDVLSDVLRIVRLSGAVFFTARFSEPWSIRSSPPEELLPALMPDAECLSIFHVLAEGRCWVTCPQQTPLQMTAGDVIVFPRGDQHEMSSDPSLPARPMVSLLGAPVRSGMGDVHFGGGGDQAVFVCGYLHTDQKFNPLFGALPTMLCVRAHDGAASVERRSQMGPGQTTLSGSVGIWMESTVRYLIEEAAAHRPGNEMLRSRLTELMFVEILRQLMQALPADEPTWLGGLRDPAVGRALELLHADPSRDWTVDALARETGLSRSVLADRFAHRVGMSPIRYLTTWRMQLARHLLSAGDHSLQEIAERIGYASEYAFNRAFRRIVGQPPATWSKPRATP